MEAAPPRSSSVGAVKATGPHEALFSADALLDALDGYEDLPFDLILAGAEDLEFSPLESPGSPISRSSPTSASSGDRTPRASDDDPGGRVPRSRKLRDERAFLQDQIAQLERELAAIQRSKPSAPALWRDVATRQRARRSVAERENERLRGKLLRQVQVAKSLQVVLHRRNAQLVSPCVRRETISNLEDDAWMDDLGVVLRRFAVDIEHAYGSIDAIFPALEAAVSEGDTPRNTSVVRCHVDASGVEQLYVETTQTFTLPFPANQVLSVAWLAYTTHFERQQRQLELYCSTDELFACKFAGGARALAIGEDKSGSTAAATGIARRYSGGENSATVVWRGFIAPASGTLREALAVTTGWIDFRPLTGCPQYAVARVCIRTVPKCSSVTALADQRLVRLPTRESAELAAFTSQRLCTTAEDIMAVIEEVENLLLDAM